jgi:hypothetical protein
MDINTMLSAAYDAYEKVKMELVAANETIRELTDELDAIKSKGDTETPDKRGPGEAD